MVDEMSFKFQVLTFEIRLDLSKMCTSTTYWCRYPNERLKICILVNINAWTSVAFDY